MSTAFIGGGTMAEAILARALERGALVAASVTVAEPVAERRAYLASTYGIGCTTSNTEAAAGAQLVVLAVKPQHFDAVAQDLAGHLKDGQTVMSIMAGITIERLCTKLRHAAVIRVMPNTPAQVGEGASVWTATAQVSGRERDTAAALLEAIGYQAYVEDEGLIDAATAISGSGPAYVFRFMEALTAAAVACGLPAEMSAKLVEQTLYGSVLLAKGSTESPSRLRELVTSPGGTTEAGLKALAEGGFEKLIADAANAAYQRAKELGNA